MPESGVQLYSRSEAETDLRPHSCPEYGATRSHREGRLLVCSYSQPQYPRAPCIPESPGALTSQSEKQTSPPPHAKRFTNELEPPESPSVLSGAGEGGVRGSHASEGFDLKSNRLTSPSENKRPFPLSRETVRGKSWERHLDPITLRDLLAA